MKILFLMPPDTDSMVFETQIVPLGIMSIASLISDQGNSVKIYVDWDCRPSQISQVVKDYQPDIVGISCDSGNRLNCFKIAKMVKSINKDILVVFGGIHAMMFHRKILEMIPEVDVIVRGEGEETFLDLMVAIKNGGDLSDVRGISFRKGSDVVANADRAMLKNLDVLPFLKFELLETEKMISNHLFDPWVVQTSRGCPFGCKFCASVGMWERVYRSMSPERVGKELLELKYKYKQDRFSFVDLTFTCQKKRVEDICHFMIDHRLLMTWTCFSDIRSADKPLFELMKEAGCEYIVFGVESFSDKMLKLMNKGYVAEQAINTLNMCQEAGLTAIFKLLFGFPGESEETLRENVAPFKKLRQGVVCAGINIFEPQPGALIYPVLERHHLVDDTIWFTNFKMGDFVRTRYPQKLVEAIYRVKDELEGFTENNRRSTIRHSGKVNSDPAAVSLAEGRPQDQ